MPDSFTRPLAIEHQPPEDPLHLFERRILAELGHGQRVRRFRELVHLIIVGQFKSYFHAGASYV